MELNAVQKEILAWKDGPALVVAGPGSGKTAVITGRAAYLVQNYPIQPQQLLIMTFTKAAAEEMRHRLRAQVGNAAEKMHIRTIHGFCYQLLQHFRGSMALADDNQQRHQLRALLRRNSFSDENLEPFMQEWSRSVNTSTPWRQYQPKSLDHDIFQIVAGQYVQWKESHSLLDFDDLLAQAKERLEALPPRSGRYIMVDEFQDTSQLQYKIVRRLAAADHNIVVVGDDDQSIYSWRGADQVLQLFRADYPQAAVFDLVENFRCPSKIVAASTALIENNKKRFSKTLHAQQSSHRRPKWVRPKNERKEATWAVEILRKAAEDGVDWTAMAVVYRMNRQGVLLKQELESKDIPYRTLGGEWDALAHWAAQDLLAYLRAVVDYQDATSFFRILNRPGRYISKALVQQAQRDLERHGGSAMDCLRAQNLPGHVKKELASLHHQLQRLGKLKAQDAIRYVRTALGYDDFVSETCEKLRLDRDNAVDAAHILTQLPEPGEEITAFLDRMGKSDAGYAKRQDGVTLTTAHSVKGLEFTTVVVIGVVEDVFPHKKAAEGNDWSDLEEERRLMYVAVTRSRKDLWISSPKKFRSDKADTSRFVEEMKEHLQGE